MPNRVAENANWPEIKASEALYARAEKLVPAATQTLAKGPGQFVRGVAPKFLARGKGARVWDVDGNEYLDYQMAVGPLVLGYGYPAVDDAVRAQLDDGITFSLVHPLEVEVAELVAEVVPGAEAVRYSKTGADATSAAVRLSRAFTGKNKVLCCGYHGWHDWYIGVTDRDKGIPAGVKDLTYTVPYNDLAAVADSIDDDTACLILEPTVFEAPKPGYLQELRRLCTERGVLLVFDEMWTGFRLAVGGAQERFDVRADLACFSKAIANGMPLSVLTGRRDVMKLLEKDVFFFTTFGGEALSLAAAKATIGELRAKKVPQALDALGLRLKQGFEQIVRENELGFVSCSGFGARTLVSFAATGRAEGQSPLEMKSLVQQELLRWGILWSGFHTMSFSHTEADVEHTLAAYRAVLPTLARAVDDKSVRTQLRGEPVEPVFRRTSNFDLKPKKPKG